MEVGRTVREARLHAGLTQAELARRSGTSQATLSAYESGAKTPSAATLDRVLLACGRRLTTEAATRPVRDQTRNLDRRGRTLAAVLDLADRLPSRHAPVLRYPKLSEG
jgi:transcriptional regulator with XRE-family HTH domain